MSDYDFDLITIGGGSGGVRASRFAASTYGAKTAEVTVYPIGPTTRAMVTSKCGSIPSTGASWTDGASHPVFLRL